MNKLQGISGLLAVAGLCLSPATWAATIGEVGAYDDPDLFAGDINPPNSAEELAALCAMPGVSCTGTETLTTSDADWEPIVDGGGGYAFQFCDLNGCQTPDYFLIKLGGGSIDPADTTYIFANSANLTWAALSQEWFNGIINPANGRPIDDGKISHVSWITTASVPEPGTLALLGLGLAGIGFARRRKSH